MHVLQSSCIGQPRDIPEGYAALDCFRTASFSSRAGVRVMRLPASRLVADAFLFPAGAVNPNPTQHDMSTRPSTPKYRLYPAYCFRASPTFDAWVKLTAADIQALRYEPEFPGSPCRSG